MNTNCDQGQPSSTRGVQFKPAFSSLRRQISRQESQRTFASAADVSISKNSGGFLHSASMQIGYLLGILFSLSTTMANADSQIHLAPSNPVPAGFAEKIIGGAPALLKDWPATVVFSTQPDKEGNKCTATIVGPKVALTAAHCVEAVTSGFLTLSGKSTSVECFVHPDYSTANANHLDADYAICVFGKELDPLPFEKINIDSNIPKLNSSLILLGYGCRKEGGVDKTFGALFFGPATVKVVPAVGTAGPIETFGSTAACFGDSGGGSYLQTGKDRMLVGLVSRGNAKDQSLLAPIAAKLFQDWAKKLAQQHGDLKICGLHKDAAGCRGDL